MSLIENSFKNAEQIEGIFFQSFDTIADYLNLSYCENKTSLDIKSLSSEQLRRFFSATHYEIRHIKLESNDRLKCKNFDHYYHSNKCRYFSYTMSNLQGRIQNHTPNYFHNFFSYDSKIRLNVINVINKVKVPPMFFYFQIYKKLEFLTYNKFTFKDSL